MFSKVWLGLVLGLGLELGLELDLGLHLFGEFFTDLTCTVNIPAPGSLATSQLPGCYTLRAKFYS